MRISNSKKQKISNVYLFIENNVTFYFDLLGVDKWTDLHDAMQCPANQGALDAASQGADYGMTMMEKLLGVLWNSLFDCATGGSKELLDKLFDNASRTTKDKIIEKLLDETGAPDNIKTDNKIREKMEDLLSGKSLGDLLKDTIKDKIKDKIKDTINEGASHAGDTK